ncbi:MAG: VacJ family lipoprotein [Alphaproteobacteria bacterium]|nr:VacJ family lipoprotein [Alphaproteobacteria bacterium]MCY4499822.1 VacJ family lipoprotein [Rhodospirillaceae bacterium]
MTLTGRFVIRALSAAFAANVVLAACATPPADDPEARAELAAINDPWEPFNRAVFEFNRAVDQVLFEPVAQAYRGVVPDFGREMVKNFLNNLRSPVILANDVLQGEKDRAGDTGSRLMANTIFGLGGLFDITEIEFHNEDFGQTLAVWGVDEGPYLVLPLLGPSPIRDTVGLVGDTLMDPVFWYAHNTEHYAIPWVRFGMRANDTRSRNIETLDEIERGAIDFYATVRSLYRQRRNDEILNGKPPQSVPMAEISWDEDEEAETNQASAVVK